MTLSRLRLFLAACLTLLFFVPLALAQPQNPNATPDIDTTGGAMAGGAGGICFFLFYAAFIILILASMWVVFTKAGKPGWAAIVPIYNIIVMLEIVEKPIWWILLFLIPCVNIVVSIMVHIELAKKFGKGAGFGIGLAFLAPIFYPILAFGSAQYEGTGQAPRDY